MSLVLRRLKRPPRVTRHSTAFGSATAEFAAPFYWSKLGLVKMSIEDSLRTAIENARDGRKSFLSYTFETPGGEVDFLAQIVLDGDTIVCKDVCVYAAADPPGIKKSTITQALLSELRALLQSGQSLGYAEMHVQGKRTAGSSSANVGKIVDIRRRRKRCINLKSALNS
jgi:hypothetical protein